MSEAEIRRMLLMLDHFELHFVPIMLAMGDAIVAVRHALKDIRDRDANG